MKVPLVRIVITNSSNSQWLIICAFISCSCVSARNFFLLVYQEPRGQSSSISNVESYHDRVKGGLSKSHKVIKCCDSGLTDITITHTTPPNPKSFLKKIHGKKKNYLTHSTINDYHGNWEKWLILQGFHF
jgi:hypothetical protein